MKRLNSHALLVLFCLLLGCALRFAGLMRGSSDFILPEQQRRGATTAFYSFHPDEKMIIDAALEPIDLLHPPFTVYGMLPIYLLRGTLKAAAFALDWESLTFDSLESTHRIYYTTRFLAALFSCLTLWLTWVIGRRYFGRSAAMLGLIFTALAPGAIQQAHFFIVDGQLALVSLAAMWALLHSLETGKISWYALAGLFIGVTASVKLNGSLLGLVLLAGFLVKEAKDRDLTKLGRCLLDSRLWLAGGVALLVLLAIEPFLAIDPGLLWRSSVIGDFGASLEVATGEVLRPWTLADVHTVPYLHHWSHLLPLIAGWPLTLAFIAGIAHVLWKRKLAPGLMLLWSALYFGLIGGLHAKHVRYLIPLLPFLSLFAANLCAHISRRSLSPGLRRPGLLLTSILLLYSLAYGLAFARIYLVEDSRVQTARWISQQIPAASRIGVEQGGFSMQSLISGEKFSRQSFDLGRLFETRGYRSCRSTLDYLQRRIADVDYIVVTDVNRYRQFTAVPELYPVVAEFYQRLWDGKLGFIPAARFKEYPALGGLAFYDDDAEPSFLGYDHPTVRVFERSSRGKVETTWAKWRNELEKNPSCADHLLDEAAVHAKVGNLSAALQMVQTVLDDYPELKITHLLEASIHRRLGDLERETTALARFAAGYQGMTADLVPWAVSLSMIDLDLPHLAMFVLHDGTQLVAQFHAVIRERMANTYIEVGDLFEQRNQRQYAVQVYQLATQVYPKSGTYANLGLAFYKQGRLDDSRKAYEKALEMDEDNLAARINLGWNLYLQGKLEEAIAHYLFALEKAPHHSQTHFNLGIAYLARGDIDSAHRIYARAIAQFDPDEGRRIGAVEDLKNLISRGVRVRQAQEILEAYWP